MTFAFTPLPDAISQELGFAGYESYRRSDLWKSIRTRILNRDGQRCVRCSGRAKLVHHMDYTIEILKGMNDNQLVSICDGCHTVLHIDESGNKRPYSEWQRILDTKQDVSPVFEITVDLRRKNKLEPSDWKRMSARWRQSWIDQYQKRRAFKYLEKNNSERIRSVLNRFGVSSHNCDQYLKLPRRLRKRAADLLCRVGTEIKVGARTFRIARVVAVWAERSI
jgi:hypothetical protein